MVNPALKSVPASTSPYNEFGERYIDSGYSAIPIEPGTKKPGKYSSGEWHDGMSEWTRFCDRKPSEIEIGHWTKWPDAGVGVACGFNGLVAIDIDTDESEIVAAIRSAIPDSPVSKKGAKGETRFYRGNVERTDSDGEITGSIASVQFKINGKAVLDVLAHGRQTVLPPTVHPDTGVPYQWLGSESLDYVSIDNLPELPDDINDRLTTALAQFDSASTVKPVGKSKAAPSSAAPSRTRNPQYVKGAINAELARLANTSGGRNDQLNKSAFALGTLVGAGELAYDKAEELLFDAATENGYVEKDGASEARATIKSGLDAGVKEPRKIPTPTKGKPAARRRLVAANDNDEEYDCLNGPSNAALPVITQDAVAMRFTEIHGDKLRYCYSTGAWFEWTGVVWRKNETQLAFNWARRLSRELSASSDDKEMKEVQKASFARAVEDFCQADTAHAVTIDNWDNDPFKLGTPGGTVDLRTGVLSPAKQSDGITKLTSVAPAETADCPLWIKFLKEATGNDEGLIRYLQQWCGYSLAGDTREHALVFVYGDGGNGKGVFLNMTSGILNQYSATASMDTFTASRDSKHPTDLAMLRGARMVTASETEEGKSWAESRIKQMTGGDPITARFMHKNFFTYKPQFKLTIVGNHKPVLQNVDDAMRRRFNIIPFTRKPETPDKELESKLRNEWPAILRWMIAGCLDWLENGLVRPESIVTATREYFDDQDLFGQWLAECCDVEPGNRYKSANATALFNSWSVYAVAAGEDPGKAKRLSANLLRKGLTKKKEGVMVYTGIMLKRPAVKDE
jgi:putative DNA primase/helicase